VNARVLVRTDRNAITIPSTAVQLGPNGSFTYVVKGDSTVEVRPLKTGAESNGMTIITTGLALNEQVVTTNQYRLQAGTHVRTVSTAGAASSTPGTPSQPTAVPHDSAALSPRNSAATPNAS
jgi:multidrug efflux system membrane fusion protein